MGQKKKKTKTPKEDIRMEFATDERAEAFTLGLTSSFPDCKFTLSDVLSAWVPLLYTGVISSGVGYTLQILGQRTVNPTVASLILSLESVFAALAGWVLLSQPLSPRELVGCALVFVAVVLAQLPGRSAENQKVKSK